MDQLYLLKNLPAPLPFLIRPMLLISVGLHGSLLLLPMPSEQKSEVPQEKEPEKVKITQLPSTPKPSPRSSPISTPKPTLQLRQTPRPQQSPIRQPSTIPPIPSPTPSPSIVRSQPSPTPQQSPTPEKSPKVSASPEQSPSPTSKQSPSPEPERSLDSTVKDPFADFPIYPNTQAGSLGLLSGEIDKSARNTTDDIEQVATFFNKELPAKKFNATPLTQEANLKIYQVSKKEGTPQFLHLISKDGQTVIILASQEITDLKALQDAQTQSSEEIAFNDAIANVENALSLAAFETDDINNLPEPSQFADTNKFRFRSKTLSFQPMTPDELFAQIQAQLTQSGFTQIAPETSYGGGNTYKISQGGFTTYLYLVPTNDNRTAIVTSKEPPL